MNATEAKKYVHTGSQTAAHGLLQQAKVEVEMSAEADEPSEYEGSACSQENEEAVDIYDMEGSEYQTQHSPASDDEGKVSGNV